MFKLFKKESQPKEVVVMERPRSNNEIVEEIHETFYTEVDKLLAEAKISNSLETDKQYLLDKCERLEKLGFSRSKEVMEAQEEISRLAHLRQENAKKQDLIEAINYFSFKYPHYKFITEQSVKKICEKYGLIYGVIGRYLGIVPDKNLEHIEQFKISEEDECYAIKKYNRYLGSISSTIYKSKEDINKRQQEYDVRRNNDPSWIYMQSMMVVIDEREVIDKEGLEICAPQKDFNLEGAEIKNKMISKVIPPDPIVLCPVVFKNQKYYLIVTAWGNEASDENVVNQKMN